VNGWMITRYVSVHTLVSNERVRRKAALFANAPSRARLIQLSWDVAGLLPGQLGRVVVQRRPASGKVEPARQLREHEKNHGENDSPGDPRKILSLSLSLSLIARVGTRRGDPGVGSPRKHDTTIRRYESGRATISLLAYYSETEGEKERERERERGSRCHGR